MNAAAWIAALALVGLAAVCVALIRFDLREHRLPDRILLPALAGVAALLVLAGALAGDWARIVGTIGGAAVLFAVYLLLAVLARGGIGGGDVKLAALLGAALGYFGWSVLVVGAALGFVFGGLWALVALRRGRGPGEQGGGADRAPAPEVPFGPAMIAGAWGGIALGFVGLG